jgi:hypothetical protein
VVEKEKRGGVVTCVSVRWSKGRRLFQMANAGELKVVVTVGKVSDEAATSIEDLGVSVTSGDADELAT